MIEWLSGWLREIVLVVLFAVVVDMLLPNNMMQRYIKVVVSLFILLTILSPILTLLRSDDHLVEIGARLDRWSSPHFTETAMASQREIEEDAARLREANEQQTLAWVEARLADMMKQDLAEQGLTQVAEVQVDVVLERTGYTNIREIHVYAGGSEQQNRADSDGEQAVSGESRTAEGQIAKIEPVVVRIDLSDSASQPSVPASAEKRSTAPAITAEERAKIRERISTVWEVSPDQIMIHEATR